jgi:hypothetical protein
MNRLKPEAVRRCAHLGGRGWPVGANGACGNAVAAAARPAHVQNTYATPEDAAKALADAMRTDEPKLIWRVLGPGAANSSARAVRSG